jgi:hypothetical protein
VSAAAAGENGVVAVSDRILTNDDVQWFQDHPDRNARIRVPAFAEFMAEWQQLGMHHMSRRRVLVWRVPKKNPKRHLVPDGLMRIPFLPFADESIEDDDKTILTILDDLMKNEANYR